MSNPSGTGPGESHEEGPRPEAQAEHPEVDHDPVTEVIEIPTEISAASAASASADERRYTAPGFDAGFTQIIDRIPDDETGLMAAPTQAFPSSPRVRAATPQAIVPRNPRRPGWLIPILLLVAALAAAGVVGLLLVKRSQAAQTARENAVRSAIETFDAAVRDGDLATLRKATCGQTQRAYENYDDKAWAETYARVSAAKQYPVVASIDEVVINGEHAEANVTTYMAFDPATKSIRSFDLQLRGDQWKICQSS
ncbi:MAG: DUF4878 domain-containing protein [Mycobacterium sp.]|nr:DUF4878 domain-containing protein [Mycobacterium sp.]